MIIAKSVNFGSSYTGLSTIGYTLLNSDNSVNQARTTTGVTELSAGTGIYGAQITFPDNWTGYIIWDTGDVNPSRSIDNFDSRSYQVSATAPTIGLGASPKIAKSVNFGAIKTGLSTIGYTLLNADKTVNQARTTSGITEIQSGTGIYGGDLQFPSNFTGFILWDTGDSNPYYAIENFDTRSYDATNVPQTNAFTYTYFPRTPVGMVRNLIGDTGPAFVLADDEINAMFSLTNQDFFMTASVACTRMAASQIAISIIRKAGNFMQDMTSIATNLMKLADKYEEMSRSVPCEAQAEVIYTDFNYNQLLTDKTHRGEPFDSF